MLFELNGRGLLTAVTKDSVMAQAQHQSDECFIDHWLFHRCKFDASIFFFEAAETESLG